MNWDDIRIFLEVARTEKLTDAAKRLSMDSSTVSRRVHKLEEELVTKLFERTVEGHKLTQDGKRLLDSAGRMDLAASEAKQLIQSNNQENCGLVRIGVTEAFGNFFITPRLKKFSRAFPNIQIDIINFARVVKISRNEADIAITVDKPKSTSVIINKLCDYSLKLYCSKQFLENKTVSISNLEQQPWVSYVDNLLFTDQLSFAKEIGISPNLTPIFRSTSITSQYQAIKHGIGIGILPTFLGEQDDKLVSLCESEINLRRSFYLVTHPESKRLSHVNSVWNYLKELVEDNYELLLSTKDK